MKDLLSKRKLGVNGVQPSRFDQPCCECEEPMIGIIKYNTQPEHEDTVNRVARLMCDPCMKKLGEEIT